MTLKRLGEFDQATLGVMLLNGQPRFVTLEEPWRENQRHISCIPAGEYDIERHHSPRFGELFTIKNVPGRSHVHIHWGNDTDDTTGCPLLGLQFGRETGKAWVVHSRIAFDQFMDAMKGLDKAKLRIEKTF